MLTVIIGIVILVLGFWLSCRGLLRVYKPKAKAGFMYAVGIVLGAIGMVSIIAGFIFPLNGYDKPIVKEEINLMPIYEDDVTGEEIYAIKTCTGEYFIKYYDEDNIIFTTIDCNIIPDDNIQNPVMRVNEYKYKQGIWTFGFGSDTVTILVLPSANVCE